MYAHQLWHQAKFYTCEYLHKKLLHHTCSYSYFHTNKFLHQHVSRHQPALTPKLEPDVWSRTDSGISIATQLSNLAVLPAMADLPQAIQYRRQYNAFALCLAHPSANFQNGWARFIARWHHSCKLQGPLCIWQEHVRLFKQTPQWKPVTCNA